MINPQAVVPMVIETTGRGERAYDIFSLLLKSRIVLVSTPINDQTASLIIAQLIYLSHEDPEAPIEREEDSPLTVRILRVPPIGSPGRTFPRPSLRGHVEMACYFVVIRGNCSLGGDLAAGSGCIGTTRRKVTSLRQVSGAGDLALEDHPLAAVAWVFDGYGS